MLFLRSFGHFGDILFNEIYMISVYINLRKSHDLLIHYVIEYQHRTDTKEQHMHH